MVKETRSREFGKAIRAFYKEHGRHHLPWRHTRDPYKVLVSEVMLQQTQVDRVLPKYKKFIRKFPNVRVLSRARLSSVLKLWSGLGYNRRAKMLHEAAKTVIRDHNGVFPRRLIELEALPGVGPYTARAVRVFAYNEMEEMIETNIRSVLIHEFFPKKKNVPDVELVQLSGLIPKGMEPREWYAALMDYGTHLKKQYPNPSRRSKHHVQQSTFKGSRRELRGCIVRELTKRAQAKSYLANICQRDVKEVAEVLLSLHSEGLVCKKGTSWSL